MRFLYENIDDEKYRLDSEYSFFNSEMPKQSLERLSDFVSECKSVVLLRLFCKEEIFAKINQKYSQFQNFASHHESNWKYVRNYLAAKTNIKIKEFNPSSLTSYLPLDTHLSVRGNFELANCVKNIIDNELN